MKNFSTEKELSSWEVLLPITIGISGQPNIKTAEYIDYHSAGSRKSPTSTFVCFETTPAFIHSIK